MPNGVLHRRGTGGWNPSSDSTNAPQGTLLRADNLQLDEVGLLALRKGSSKVNAVPFADLDVHSLASFELSGTTYRMAGADDNVYANGTSLALDFDGTGDIAMHSHLGQIFMARGQSKHKYDGTTVRTWGLPTPVVAPQVTAVDLTSKYFATCGSTESPAFTAPEGAINATFPTGEDGVANGAIEVTPDLTTGRGTLLRLYTAGTDYLVLGSAVGGPNDSFSMSVKFSNPEDIEFVQIQISCVGDASVSDYFASDYYTYKWVPNEVRAMALTAEEIVAAMTDEAMAEAALELGYTPEQAKAAAKKGLLAAEVQAKVREDNEGTAGVSVLKFDADTWQRLVVPRTAFTRVGSTSGYDWRTIKGITLVYKARVGSASTCQFDSIKIVSADGSKLLTGRYRFCYRFARQFTGYLAVGPVSPPSEEIFLSAQGARITLPAGSTAGLDDQVDTVEVFVFGGLLNAYYKAGAAYIGLDTNPRSMRLDEFDRYPDGAVSITDRIRGSAFCIFPGFQPGYLDFHAGETFSFNVYASELSLLRANEALDLQNTVPPADIIDIEGPYFERILVLTDKYLYPSRRRNPDTFCLSHALPVTAGIDEVAYWVKKGPGGLYVGTSADIYRLEGSFEELPGGLLAMRRIPLCVGLPPVGAEIVQTGAGLIYRASDGLRFFNGETTQSLNGNLERLFVEDRHGVSKINQATGRFRMAVSRGVLHVIVPEGADTVHSPARYRLRLTDGLWFRDVYGVDWRSIATDEDGTLFAGDTAGTVWLLDTGDHDGTSHIPVTLWTPVEDDDMPLARKEPYDLQVLVDTGAEAASLAVHQDGSATAATTLTATTSGAQMYREDLADTLSPAIGWQLRVTGSFSAFKWYHWTLSYRYHPQHRLFLDWLPDIGTQYAWARFIRLKAILFNTVRVSVYEGSTLLETQDITSYTSGVLDVFRIRLGREVKGRQLRVQFAAVNATAIGDVGFEPYYVEMVYRGSGSTTEKTTRQALMPAERVGGGQEPQ